MIKQKMKMVYIIITLSLISALISFPFHALADNKGENALGVTEGEKEIISTEDEALPESEDDLAESVKRLEEEMQELLDKLTEQPGEEPVEEPGEEPIEEEVPIVQVQIEEILLALPDVSYIITPELLENPAFDECRSLILELSTNAEDLKNSILAEILIIDVALKNNLIEVYEDNLIVKSRFDALCRRIKAAEIAGCTNDELQSIRKTRLGFNRLTGSKMSLTDTEVVVVNSPVKIDGVLLFNGSIVAPAESLCKLTKSRFIPMEQNRNFAIQSDGLLIECITGQNEIFVNDRQRLLTVANFMFDQRVYLPVSAFCDAFGIKYINVTPGLLVMYGNYDVYKPLD